MKKRQFSTFLEILPSVIRTLVDHMEEAANGRPAGATYTIVDGRRVCVYVVPARMEEAIDNLIGSIEGSPTVVKNRPIIEDRHA